MQELTSNITTVRSLGKPHPAEQSSASITGKAPKRNNMLYSCFRAAKIREASPRERQAASDILNAHLLMVEIMMGSIVQKYVYNVYSTIEERGLMRHNVKRQAKNLQMLSFDLIGRCNAHDIAQVNVFCRDIYPPLVKNYIEEGGTLAMKLQTQFYSEHRARIDLIYFATKNAVDKMNVGHSDLLANIFMITMFAHTGIEFYNLMAQKTDKLMEGFGKITRIKSHHNEKMLCAAKELLRACGCPNELPDKEATHARTLSAQFQRLLTNEDLLKMFEQGITSLRMDYIEFVIATLRLRLADNSLSMSDVRALHSRLGSIKNVRLLLTEIAAIPLPYGSKVDVIELAQTLPDVAPQSGLATFRRLCMEDNTMQLDPEAPQTVRLRELRQETRSNLGVLPVGTLRQLYAELGTKKAVIELLALGGAELKLSIKEMKAMKIEKKKAISK